jgi:hypothetical protein
VKRVKIAPPETGQQYWLPAKVFEHVENASCLMGGAGEYEARKNGQSVDKPSRNHQENDKRRRILLQARLCQEALVDPEEDELGWRGKPRRR